MITRRGLLGMMIAAPIAQALASKIPVPYEDAIVLRKCGVMIPSKYYITGEREAEYMFSSEEAMQRVQTSIEAMVRSLEQIPSPVVRRS